MKTTSRFALSIFLCAFCAFLWPNLLPAKDASPPTIKVASIRGKARYTTNITAKVWAPVDRGTLLPANSVIQTASNGSAVHLILEQKQHHGFDPGQRQSPFYTWTEITSTLTINENSVIAIDRFDFEKTKHGTISHTRFDLRAGSITGDTRKLSPQSDYQITCDKLTAQITPGEYFITDAGKVITSTGTAQLKVKHPDGTVTTTHVNANLLYDPAIDKTMPIPAESKLFPRVLDETDFFAPRAKAPTTPNLRPGI